jgi:copper oxidase (laccase) domain-containing protein
LDVSSGNAGSGAVAATLGLSYALVRECAMAVWERVYPDEAGQLVPRWKVNKTTKNLKFSHKWVIGLLRRVQAARGEGANLSSLIVTSGQCCYTDARKYVSYRCEVARRLRLVLFMCVTRRL